MLSRRKSKAAAASQQSDETPSQTSSQQPETIAAQNLPFVILAALAGSDACSCGLAVKVHSCNSIFLPLGNARIDSEVQALVDAGQVIASDFEACSCSRNLSLSEDGHNTLADGLQYCRRSGLLPRDAGGPDEVLNEMLIR
jgi:hypothetical protein